MEVKIQSGYKIRFKRWSDMQVYEKVIEGAVKFKAKKHEYSDFREYYFYNKKGGMISFIGRVEMLFVDKIFTTVMQEERTSMFKKILEFINH